MKKMILGVLVFVAIGVGALILLRSMEPRVPTLPPAPPPAPVTAPTETPGMTMPVAVTPGTPLPGAPTAPTGKDHGLPADLILQLQAADTLAAEPDQEKVRNGCFANPRLAAERLGMKAPEPLGVAGNVASMLCKRENTGCDMLNTNAAAQSSKANCANPPCPDGVFLASDELMGGSPSDCREWTSYLLLEAAAIEGTPYPECRKFPPLQGRGLSEADLDHFCGLLANDIRTGDHAFCRELVGKPRGSEKINAADCVRAVENYFDGAETCPKGGKSLKFNHPSCELQARVKLAVQGKDLAACEGNPFCYAFLSPAGCEEYRFVDLRNPGWQAVCDRTVSAAMVNWFKEVESRYAPVRADLEAYQKKLDALPAPVRSQAEERIAGAIKALEGGKFKADKLRKGSVLEPGTVEESAPVMKKRKKGAKKR